MKANYLIIALVFLLVGVSQLMADEFENGERTFKMGKGGTLTLEINSGSIHIKTWEKEEIKLETSGISEESLKSLEVTTKGNELLIKLWRNDDDEDYQVMEFTIPAQLNLNLKTMSGDVEVGNNIEGSVRIDTYGGNIITKNIVGSASLETKGGDIMLYDVTGNCSVNTYGGDIQIGEIKGGSATVQTNGGDVKIKSVAKGISTRTYGGDINIGDIGGNSDLSTYGGDVNTGYVNGNLRMETYGGDLRIKGADGSVVGKTNGGDIDLGKVDGSVDVKTLSGSVVVELNPAPNSESKISTNFGAVELIVPPTAKTTIEARIHVQGYWKEDKENYSIDSDYKEKSINYDDKKKNIVGVYELNGGGSKIFIKNVNDNIVISKNRKTPKE
jgi:DUF4097 and DUF4098 domain-containing protein YvlB